MLVLYTNDMSENQKQLLIDNWRYYREITDERLLHAFMEIPRENFIGDNPLSDAYHDHPLPIGFGQTISQPTTVMLMLQLLNLESTHTVLEIGGGSGYNAAIMSKLAGEVVSVEIIPELVKFAKENLSRSNISNVTMIHSDGKAGYAKKAPYDRIIVTACAKEVPDDLFAQLKTGGVLLAPVGNIFSCTMMRFLKREDNDFETSEHGLFSFVPLT